MHIVICSNRHSDPIQCLAYNPVTLHLASCALSDFAFWSVDVKAVQKFRVTGRITSCAWSPNGQHLAIGLASGAVSIRDKVLWHFNLRLISEKQLAHTGVYVY